MHSYDTYNVHTLHIMQSICTFEKGVPRGLQADESSTQNMLSVTTGTKGPSHHTNSVALFHAIFLSLVVKSKRDALVRRGTRAVLYAG